MPPYPDTTPLELENRFAFDPGVGLLASGQPQAVLRNPVGTGCGVVTGADETALVVIAAGTVRATDKTAPAIRRMFSAGAQKTTREGACAPRIDHLPKEITETQSIKERRIAFGHAGCAMRWIKTR